MGPVELLTFITNYSLMLVSFGLVLLFTAAVGTRTAISGAVRFIIWICFMFFCFSTFVPNAELLIFIVIMVSGAVGVMSYIAFMACGLLSATPTRLHPLLRAGIALVGFAMLAAVLLARYVY